MGWGNGSGFWKLADDAGWVACGDGSGGEIASDDGVGSNDHPVTNGYAFEDRAVGSDENVVSDVYGCGSDGLSAAERNLVHVRVANQATGSNE